MMVTIQPLAGDWGTEFRFRMLDQDGDVIDLSSATQVRGLLQKPDGAISALTGSLFTDGTDGQFVVIAAEGVLADEGPYVLEPVVTFTNGEWAGTPRRFMVGVSLRG